MKKITLYTGEHGYKLFEQGLPFLASEERKFSHDYTVTAPIENVVEYPLEDDIDCYDVLKMDGVTVKHG